MPRVLLHLFLTLAACASVAQGQLSPSSPQSQGGPDAAPLPDASAPPSASRDGAASARLPPAAAGDRPSDRGAEADFGAARARFDAGDHQGARAALEAFVGRHADHPSRPAAEILLGRLALGRGDALAARKVLEPPAAVAGDAGAGTGTGTGMSGANANATSARYYLGLAELRLGNSTRARALLSPFLPKGAADPSPGDDAAIELRGALAEATVPADPVLALELLEGYLRVAREHEKAWARDRSSEIAARVAPETAWRAYGAAPASGLTRAVLGAKAAAHLRSRGDASGATFIETETAAARHALGMDVAMARVGPGDPTRIGLALPLSGKFQVVGEAALRAAMLAGGAPSAGGTAGAGAQLLIRDTATDADRATRGVAELTRTEAVIGIVGAAGGKTSAAAVAHASRDGIPMLVLEDAAPGALTTAFQIMHTPEARAAALARHALKLGVRKFAVVGPDSNAGKRLRAAFRKAVTDGGGTVVADATYVAGATSFTGAIASLKKATFDAIFVPDSAERLPLIAPALAVADLWPQPWTKPRASATPAKAQPRSVLLLSTASELTGKLLDSAGRYVQGALLCPGFFADDGDPRARGFVEAYRAAYGTEPHATEAYAYDAVATLRAVTQRGARTRADVLKALGAPGGAAVLQGLTGNVAFGPDHGRVDNPLIYLVDGDAIRAVKP